jgi:glycosyltransferase involved in cell wall biosynthesis
MTNRNILFISELPIYNISSNIGIKVLDKTISGYLNDNWNVFIIYPRINKHDNISIKHNNFFVKSFYAGIYYNLSKIKYLSYLSKLAFWPYFIFKVKNIVLISFFDKSFDVVYGIGPLGNFVITKSLKSRFKNSLKVGRFLGVASSYERYLTWYKRFFVYPDLLSYKLNPDVTILTNDGTKGDEFLKLINTSSTNLYFIKNGIDKKLFLKKYNSNYIINKYNLPTDIITIITVSRLSKLKRIDRCITLLNNLVHVNKNIRLFIIGDGSEKNKLKKLVSKYNLSDYVIFVGAISHSDLLYFYNSADLFFSFYDTSNAGNPLFEAMITGNCIITLDTGATRDFIPTNAGLVLKISELNNAHRIILKLLNDKIRMNYLKKNAKAFALEHMQDWDDRINYEISIIKTHMIDKFTSTSIVNQ